jgi:hypothetical protein
VAKNGTNGNGHNGNGNHAIADHSIPFGYLEVLRRVAKGEAMHIACRKEDVDPFEFKRYSSPQWSVLLNSALDYREFVRREECEYRLVSQSKIDWRAAAWYLERKYPQEFGSKLKVDQTSDGKLQITIRHVEATTCNDSDHNEVEVIRN